MNVQGAESEEACGVESKGKQRFLFLIESRGIKKCLYLEESSRLFLPLFWILSEHFVDLRCYCRCVCSDFSVSLNKPKRKVLSK